MQQVLEARVEALLSAVCAIASAVPHESQRVALATMVGGMMDFVPSSPTIDRAVAADLSRLLAALGTLNLVSATPSMQPAGAGSTAQRRAESR